MSDPDNGKSTSVWRQALLASVLGALVTAATGTIFLGRTIAVLTTQMTEVKEDIGQIRIGQNRVMDDIRDVRERLIRVETTIDAD